MKARTRHASLPIFHRPDPLATTTPGISPYAYCAGDPLNYIDPTGMKIEDLSFHVWKAMKEKTSEKLQNLETKLRKNEDDRLRIAALTRTLNTVEMLENSSTEYGVLMTSGNGSVTKGNTGLVLINYLDDSNFVHELEHCRQLETGDISFERNSEGKYSVIYNDLYDEVRAYQAQYAYNPESLPQKAERFKQITPDWVKSITIMGITPYGYNGIFNVGILPVNKNSSYSEISFSYPWLNLKNKNKTK